MLCYAIPKLSSHAIPMPPQTTLCGIIPYRTTNCDMLYDMLWYMLLKYYAIPNVTVLHCTCTLLYYYYYTISYHAKLYHTIQKYMDVSVWSVCSLERLCANSFPSCGRGLREGISVLHYLLGQRLRGETPLRKLRCFYLEAFKALISARSPPYSR